MKFKKKLKTRWHQKRLKDNFFHDAKRLGYRSRSAFKLLEINKKFRILKKGQNALDLGAAPGGWSQILMQKVFSKEKNNTVVSVDLKDFKPIKGLVLIKKNIFDKDFIFVLKKYFLEDIDIVISDAAPSTTGNKFVDHIKIVELCERSYEIAINLLNKGGILVIKIFDGKETSKICQIIKKRFLNFNLYKPKSSKSESKEIYIIAKFLK
ncbi:MAG: RlmE family RNA methyltransferase [Alphaproteobacteria bacterium]|nr:RlmE family RNA methyltransferase [Alphaproteobacteria bacterium]|tara:strand:+ start:746 stop:1372 length:627 start_codon:yes stop_codon:yes gene_type:complete